MQGSEGHSREAGASLVCMLVPAAQATAAAAASAAASSACSQSFQQLAEAVVGPGLAVTCMAGRTGAHHRVPPYLVGSGGGKVGAPG